jgi:hypothetical protein
MVVLEMDVLRSMDHAHHVLAELFGNPAVGSN